MIYNKITTKLIGNICVPSKFRFIQHIEKAFFSTSSAESRKFEYDMNLQDAKLTYGDKSASNLYRSYCIYKLCQFRPLVDNARKIYQYASKVASPLVHLAMEHTFFWQFATSIDQFRTLLPTLHDKQAGFILDYAEEDFVPEGAKVPYNPQRSQNIMDAYCQSAEYAHHGKNEGFDPFIAIKITPLTDTFTLREANGDLVVLKEIFLGSTLQHGLMSKNEFISIYPKICSSGNPSEVFESLDECNTGFLSIIEFLDLYRHSQHRVHLNTNSLKNDDKSFAIFNKLYDDTETIIKNAQSLDVNVCIDAEHSYFQTAIDHLALKLMSKYNKDRFCVFTTCQMYLKKSNDSLKFFYDTAKARGFKFSAKLVRGAYIDTESEEIASKRLVLEGKGPKHSEVLKKQYAQQYLATPESPFHYSKPETDKSYEQGIGFIFDLLRKGEKDIQVTFATHNEDSCKYVYNLIKTLEEKGELNFDPQQHLMFAQLLGMGDYLTFSLGKYGLKPYKYIPYGAVDRVVPYLLRRAQENKSMLSGSRVEVEMKLLWEAYEAKKAGKY